MNTFKIEQRTAAVNTLNAWLVVVAPKLQEYLAKAPVRVTVNNQLYKQDRTALAPFIASPPKNVRVWFIYDEYSGLVLECDISYQNNPPNEERWGSVSYHKEWVYLKNITPFEREHLDIDNILSAAARLPELQKQVSELNGEINTIKRLMGE